MKCIIEETLPYNTGKAFEVNKGAMIRIEGRTTVDIVFFNLHNLVERFDQARTKVFNGRIFVTTGDKLYSKSNNPMFSIVEDTLGIGKHDLQYGMCSASGYSKFKGDLYDVYEVKERFGVERDQIPDHGCWENLTGALEPWAISAADVPSPFNIFQETIIDGETGKMEMVLHKLDEMARMDLVAEMDCLVGVSACPWVGRGESITVSVFQPA